MAAKMEIEKRVKDAFEEIRRTRDELRVKMNLLGKDAGDVLKDAEDVAKFLEAKLTEIGEVAVKEAKHAVALVKEKVDKLATEVEKRRVARTATKPPAEPVAETKHP